MALNEFENAKFKNDILDFSEYSSFARGCNLGASIGNMVSHIPYYPTWRIFISDFIKGVGVDVLFAELINVLSGNVSLHFANTGTIIAINDIINDLWGLFTTNVLNLHEKLEHGFKMIITKSLMIFNGPVSSVIATFIGNKIRIENNKAFFAYGLAGGVITGI